MRESREGIWPEGWHLVLEGDEGEGPGWLQGQRNGDGLERVIRREQTRLGDRRGGGGREREVWAESQASS